MQVHMIRLVEVTEDIDGFKECMTYCYYKNLFIGGKCHHGKRTKGKRVLQTIYC